MPELVEVGPIIKSAARKHGTTSREVREATGRAHLAARVEAMRRMREAGMTLPAIGEFFGLDHTTVYHHVGRGGQGGARAGSRCAGCGEVLPLDAYNRDPRRADGVKSYCRACHRQVLARARHRKGVTYRTRRIEGAPRERLAVDVSPELRVLLRDTAERHRITMSYIVERALAKAMACRDCRGRLRQEGSDNCVVCDRMWTQGATA